MQNTILQNHLQTYFYIQSEEMITQKYSCFKHCVIIGLVELNHAKTF